MVDKPDTGDSSAWGWIRRLFGGGGDASTTPPIITPSPTTPSTGSGTTGYRTFGTTLSRNNSQMLKQLEQAMKYRDVIEEAARRYNFQESVICGIGSRESHWGLALRPAGPGGTGDFSKRKARGNRKGDSPPDGGGFGRGLMQIDYDFHEFARTGNWKSGRENILYGCKVLDDARRFFKSKISLSEERLLRAMLAAYNSGATATLNAIQGGEDVDARTTGKDYSKDVLNRAGWFQLQGWR